MAAHHFVIVFMSSKERFSKARPVMVDLQLHLSFESNCVYFRSVLLPLMTGSKHSRHFLNRSEAKPEPIVTCSRKFSRALRRLYVTNSNFDWTNQLFCVLCDWQE